VVITPVSILFSRVNPFGYTFASQTTSHRTHYCANYRSDRTSDDSTDCCTRRTRTSSTHTRSYGMGTRFTSNRVAVCVMFIYNWFLTHK
jgi:hypothetical protein